jgi:hypothetical protein
MRKGLIAILVFIYAVLIALLFLLQPKKPEIPEYEAKIIVVDAETEEPIKGAKVKIRTTDEECPELTLKTDADGECSFEYSDPDEMLTVAIASKSGYNDAEVEEEFELAYFLDDELVIPLTKQDVINEGREIGAQGNLKVTLLWEDSTVDLDLHILEPNGFEICYKDDQRHDVRTGGQLDIDWIPGNAEQAIGENIFWQNPPAGAYKVWVECYQPEEAPPTECNVVVYRVNQEPEVFRITVNGYHDVQQVTTIQIN